MLDVTVIILTPQVLALADMMNRIFLSFIITKAGEVLRRISAIKISQEYLLAQRPPQTELSPQYQATRTQYY